MPENETINEAQSRQQEPTVAYTDDNLCTVEGSC